MRCNECAREEMYCVICEDEEFFADAEQVEYERQMCDLLCPHSEEDINE